MNTNGQESREETRRINKILIERAQVLAQEPVFKNKTAQKTPVLLFELSQEVYAVDLNFVLEVYTPKEFTVLPCIPDFVAGVFNYRGQIISALNLCKLFGLSEQDHQHKKVMLLRDKQMEFGILIKRIAGIDLLDFSQLQLSMPTLTGIRERYIKGISPHQVIVLDAQKMLQDENIIINEHV